MGLGFGYLYCGQAHAVGGRLGDDLLREALPLLVRVRVRVKVRVRVRLGLG